MPQRPASDRMRKLSWRILIQVFNPSYGLPQRAHIINSRWLLRQSFVLSLGSSMLILIAFPIHHLVDAKSGENIFTDQPHRIAVVCTAFLCIMLPLLLRKLRPYCEFFSFLNFFILFICIAIDISNNERPRRYSSIGLLPLFGSTFIFTDIWVMTAAYGASWGVFAALNAGRTRTSEIVIVYAIAYFIAWWMATIRIRSLHRISLDQARLYERQVFDQRVQLARNLHDSLGGDLMQLSLQLAGDTPRGQMLDLAYEVIAKTKNLVYTLEPKNENENFGDYVRSYAERLTQTGKFKVDLFVEAPWPQLRMDRALNLQAVFTEWMTNTIRHSVANTIQIILRHPGSRYFLIIRDDGNGFRWNGKKTGSGLRNIALRAELLNARVFARKRGPAGGTIFFLSGRLKHD
jgi:signal transduction histidine kinase